MSNLRFFDAHCYVGRYKVFQPGSFYETDDLLQQMEYYGIVEALVTSSMSREHHPIDGNAAILREVEGRENLHPSWAALPPASKELPKPSDLVSDMLVQGC